MSRTNPAVDHIRLNARDAPLISYPRDEVDPVDLGLSLFIHGLHGDEHCLCARDDANAGLRGHPRSPIQSDLFNVKSIDSVPPVYTNHPPSSTLKWSTCTRRRTASSLSLITDRHSEPRGIMFCFHYKRLSRKLDAAQLHSPASLSSLRLHELSCSK